MSADITLARISSELRINIPESQMLYFYFQSHRVPSMESGMLK